MKQIFLAIQDRLTGRVPAFQYVDKDWNQLRYDAAPIKFPCCLIDLASIDYSQLSDLHRTATATVRLTIADQQLTRTSARAPSRAQAYAVIDLIEAVYTALEGFRIPGTTQALTRDSLEHSFSDKGHDVYTLTFSTAWVEQPNEEGEIVKTSPSITVRLNVPSE